MNQLLYQRLIERGVFREPAAAIATRFADEDMTEHVCTAFDAHIIDTGGNMALVVWRLKNGILGTGFDWSKYHWERIINAPYSILPNVERQP